MAGLLRRATTAHTHRYAFELQHGTEAEQTDVLTKCVAAEPAHGPLWCVMTMMTMMPMTMMMYDDGVWRRR